MLYDNINNVHFYSILLKCQNKQKEAKNTKRTNKPLKFYRKENIKWKKNNVYLSFSVLFISLWTTIVVESLTVTGLLTSNSE